VIVFPSVLIGFGALAVKTLLSLEYDEDLDMDGVLVIIGKTGTTVTTDDNDSGGMGHHSSIIRRRDGRWHRKAH
jgi:hypothetical protein